MPISYTEARGIIETVASHDSLRVETIAIEHAVGRVCPEDVICLESTPAFDTSAMDGFAVDSGCTRTASKSNPKLFRVKGTMAAGDHPILITDVEGDEIDPCVEIMTGAQFPTCTNRHVFDACVRWEDTVTITVPDKLERFIRVTKPAKIHQNRRFAGSDLREGNVIVRSGATISSKHVMAMAALGHSTVPVYKPALVGICSTGAELLAHDNRTMEADRIRDVNKPYISAFLHNKEVKVDSFGIVADDAQVFAEHILDKLQQQHYDVLITTGGVSDGKFDILRSGLKLLQAEILFHKVAIRPGHPILFARVPIVSIGEGGLRTNGSALRYTPIFALPGNPIASAAGLRFFVWQYLRLLLSQKWERGVSASLSVPNIEHPERHFVTFPNGAPSPGIKHLDCFRHGVWWIDEETGSGKVALNLEQSSAKIKSSLEANCWIWIPQNHGDLGQGDILQCFLTD